jgi:hypothetical protein
MASIMEALTRAPEPGDRPRVFIQGAVAEALYRTATMSAIPSLPTEMALKTIHWGQHKFDPAQGIVRIDRDELRVECAPSGELALDLLKSRMRTTGVNIESVLHDGATFRAEHVVSRNLRTFSSKDPWLTLACTEWILTPATQPSFWLGNVALAPLCPKEGNLSFIDVSDTGGFVSHDNVYLKGAYDYYLVRGTQGWTLAVWTHGGGAPNPDALHFDLLAMQMTLGQRFELEHLVGVDGDGRAVAAQSVETGSPHPRRRSCYPPVPWTEPNHCWIAPFFVRLSAAMRSRAATGIRVPVALYRDALGDHLDGAYLRYHVAVEAFAKAIRKANKSKATDILVANEEEWTKWIASQEAAIRAFAREGQSDLLLDKVHQARMAPTGNLVVDAYRHFGVELPSAMVRELKNRNYPVHTGRMRDADRGELARDMGRLGTARTLLAGLVACAVGYHGKICGWERGEGYCKEADGNWWRVDDAQRCEAATWYVVLPQNVPQSNLAVPSLAP